MYEAPNKTDLTFSGAETSIETTGVSCKIKYLLNSIAKHHHFGISIDVLIINSPKYNAYQPYKNITVISEVLIYLHECKATSLLPVSLLLGTVLLVALFFHWLILTLLIWKMGQFMSPAAKKLLTLRLSSGSSQHDFLSVK